MVLLYIIYTPYDTIARKFSSNFTCYFVLACSESEKKKKIDHFFIQTVHFYFLNATRKGKICIPGNNGVD